MYFDCQIEWFLFQAWQSWKEGAAIELMHPTLLESFAEDRALRCINVALLCVENNPLDRPSMSVVVSMLTSEIVKLPMPKQPAFCFGGLLRSIQMKPLLRRILQ